MAIKLHEMFVALGLETASFVKGSKDVSKISFNTAKEVERSFKIIGTAALGAASAWATAAGYMVKKAVDAADNFHKLSQRTGVTVETLSGLAHAASLAGVDTGALAKGLQHLSKFMVSSGEGSKDVKQKLFELADQFSKNEDGATKTAAALKIFGKAGAELIPLLNQGRSGLEGAWQEAERLGLVIDSKTAKAAEDFNDNLTRLTAIMQGWATQVMSQNIPALAALSAHLFDVASQSKQTGEVTFSWAERFAIALAYIRGNAKSLAFEFKTLGNLAAALMSGDQGRITAAFAFNSVRGEIAQSILEQEIADVRAAFRDFSAALNPSGKPGAKPGGGLAAFLDKPEKVKKEVISLGEALDILSGKVGGVDRVTAQLFAHNLKEGRLKMLEEGWAGVKQELAEISENAPGATGILAAKIEELNAKLAPTRELLVEMKEALFEFSAAGLQGLGDAMAGLQSWRNLAKQVLADLGRMIWHFLVLRPLMNMIGGALFGGLSGGFGISSGSSFLPLTRPGGLGGSLTGFASGGRFSANQPIMVGERGIEILVPDRAGEVIPNHKLGRMGGDVIVNAPGAELGTVARLQALFLRLNNEMLVGMMQDRAARTLA